jgi:hypothetical protein
MMEIELPKTELQPVMLEIEERETLGLRGSAPSEAPDRIAIGKPQCLALDRATLNRRARRFLKARSGSSYYLVAFDCSFRYEEERPLESAWLRIDLLIPEERVEGTATAWSLEPLLQYDAISVSRTVSLSAALKLTAGVGVSGELGPSGERQTIETYERRAVFLEGLGEGTSSPAWSFTRTPVAEIRGAFHLRLVAELPAASRAEGVVSVGATIKHRVLGGIFSYSANLDDVSNVRVVPIPG